MPDQSQIKLRQIAKKKEFIKETKPASLAAKIRHYIKVSNSQEESERNQVENSFLILIKNDQTNLP